MRELFEALGKWANRVINIAGGMSMILFHSVAWMFVPPLKLRNIFKQMEFVGVKSLFVVILTGAFTGAVLALQTYNALKRFGAESLVGPTVAMSMARELGPVLTGLMVTGRAGSAMATELGTMRVTEQIDALYTMAVNPVKYLISPRILAGVMMMPMLTVVADFVGVMAGYFVGVKILGINSGVYIGRTVDFVKPQDIFDGLIKASAFGLILSLAACYHGFNTAGGAAGVGEAATKSVVLGSVMILISNYFLTSMML